MQETIFGIRDIIPNNIRDFIPHTKNSYFSMSSIISLLPQKKISLIPSGIRDFIPNTDSCGRRLQIDRYIQHRTIDREREIAR